MNRISVLIFVAAFLFLLAGFKIQVSPETTLHTKVQDSLPDSIYPAFEGGSKALGKHLTSLFVFEKEPVSEFCYYNLEISASGAVTSIEKPICPKYDILNESAYNEKSIREIFTKYTE